MTHLRYQEESPDSSKSAEAGEEDVRAEADVLEHGWCGDATIEMVSIPAAALSGEEEVAYTTKLEIQLTDTEKATPFDRVLTGKTSGGKAQPSGE